MAISVEFSINWLEDRGCYEYCRVAVSGWPSNIVTVKAFVFKGDGNWPNYAVREWLSSSSGDDCMDDYLYYDYMYPGDQIIAGALGYTADDPNNYAWRIAPRYWIVPAAPEPPKPPRPDDWSWNSSVSSGFSLSWLTGQIWCDFIDRIQAFATYKEEDISDCPMTKPSTLSSLKTVSTSQVGMSLTIMQACNEVAAAINALDPPTKAPYPTAGAAISAAYFNALRDALNSIE